MSGEHAYPHALFAGLVFDESGRPAGTTQVGGVAYYIIDDQGFERHVEAEPIDRAILRQIKEQVLANQDEVTRGMLAMLGRDDLFTKGMIDASIQKMDEAPVQPLPENARTWLNMLGFHIIINIHGEVVSFELPGTAAPDDE